MRVIAGALRGRRITTAAVPGLRPTADRVREALFNILGTTVVGARVLDLYAGSGALAIEAMSRGATTATCVDSDRRAIALVEANLRSLDLRDSVRVVRDDALDYCRRIAEDGTAWDVVLSDPPYAEDPESLLDIAADAGWWTRAWVVEHEASRRPSLPASEMETRRYGDTALTFVWRT